MSIAETIVNTTTQVRSLQAEVCCYPVVIGPRTGWSVRPASRARPEPVCLNPQGRILEVSLRFGSTRENFRRLACPERDSRSLEPYRRNGPACQGFTSVADDALRFGVTQHIPAVLAALGSVSRARVTVAKPSNAVTEVAAVHLQSCWRSQDRWSRMRFFNA